MWVFFGWYKQIYFLRWCLESSIPHVSYFIYFAVFKVCAFKIWKFNKKLEVQNFKKTHERKKDVKKHPTMPNSTGTNPVISSSHILCQEHQKSHVFFGGISDDLGTSPTEADQSRHSAHRCAWHRCADIGSWNGFGWWNQGDREKHWGIKRSLNLNHLVVFIHLWSSIVYFDTTRYYAKKIVASRELLTSFFFFGNAHVFPPQKKKKQKEHSHWGLLCDLLWSDPEKEISGWGENAWGLSFACRDDRLLGTWDSWWVSNLMQFDYNIYVIFWFFSTQIPWHQLYQLPPFGDVC